MMRWVKYGFYVVIFLGFTTCEIDQCLQTAGRDVNQMFELDSIGIAEIAGVFNFELVQDTSWYLEVITGENILKHIEINNSNDSLVITNNNKCAWFKGYERPHLRLHFPNLQKINVLESCYLYSVDTITSNMRIAVKTHLAEATLILNAKKLFFITYNSTGGIYTFSGKVDQMFMAGHYNNVNDASGLIVKKAHVINESITDYKIWAEDELTVALLNTGNIYYKGNPEIIIDSVSSTGKLISLKE